ncbi:MAG: HTH-type transcriptional regulator CatM [Deltaproteobacteria bacterium ADurb.Bin510]|nr:MAG: HTH-type transcriptional regulator CatM [Deltaproteobacteria bacterium ADurb.Bin510]
MELYQIRTFVKVAETGSITRAASELNTSQPSVSAHIKALEDEYGLSLFKRSARGMELSPAGAQLLVKARAILNGLEDFAATAASLNASPQAILTVGLNTDPQVLKIDQLVDLCQNTNPRLSFNFISTNSPVVLKGLHSGEFDAGFVFGPCSLAELTCEPLTEIELKLVAPHSWHDRIQGRSLAELARLPWVMPPGECPYSMLLKAEFARLGLEPEVRLTADQEPILKSLVTAGHGLSLLPSFELKPEDSLSVWDGPGFKLALSFVCRLSRSQQPELMAFKQVLKRLWA